MRPELANGAGKPVLDTTVTSLAGAGAGCLPRAPGRLAGRQPAGDRRSGQVRREQASASRLAPLADGITLVDVPDRDSADRVHASNRVSRSLDPCRLIPAYPRPGGRPVHGTGIGLLSPRPWRGHGGAR